MLDRQIQIVTDLRLFFHYPDQFIGDLFRITVQYPDPAQSADLTKFPQ